MFNMSRPEFFRLKDLGESLSRTLVGIKYL